MSDEKWPDDYSISIGTVVGAMSQEEAELEYADKIERLYDYLDAYDEEFVWGLLHDEPDDEIESEPRERIKSLPEAADGRACRPNVHHRHLKRAKVRQERRRARANPECVATYGRFSGYET